MSERTFYVTMHRKEEKFHHLYLWMSAQEALSLIADIAKTLVRNGPTHIAIAFSGIPYEGDRISEPLEDGLGVLVTDER